MNENKTNKYVLFIIVLLLFFFSSLFRLIPAMILNIDMNNLTDNQTVYLTLFSNVILVTILILIFRFSLKKDFIEFKKNFSDIFYSSAKIWLIGLLLMTIFNLLINKIVPNDIANNEESIRNMISYSPYLMLLNTGLVAPIIEELVFRKAFRVAFKNDLAFILISGFVFGALHVVFSVETTTDFLYLLPYCSLGISFSYMYYKAKNIWAPISIHMLHNIMITLLNIFYAGLILW